MPYISLCAMVSGLVMYPMFHSTPSRSFSKHQKHFNLGNEDRISHLPEEILSKILSCLPTKQAVATSVLSKRWRNLWTLVSCLDFDDMALIDQDKYAISLRCSLLFRNFVDRVLSGHLNASSSIEKIHFEIIAWQDPRKVNHWIRSAVELNVKELALNFFFQENILMPVTLPASNKLVILKIHSNADITVPGSFCLPNAKVIILKYVSISMPHLQALISGSPALEELEIHEYLEQNLFPENALIISSSTLKRLTLREIDYDATSIQTVLLVHAPNLEFCELSGYVLDEFHKVSLPSLAWMKVDLNCGFYVNLAQFNHVSHLTVLWYAMTVLVESLNDDSNWTPFPNLTRLEVSDNGRSWMVLPAMLKLAPKLQSCIINFEDDEETCPVTKKLWYAPPALPQCLLTGLTRVEFRDLQGRKTQMGAVRYFMKNAVRLNQMIIKVDKAVINKGKKSDLIIEILNFPKGSSTCLISIT